MKKMLVLINRLDIEYQLPEIKKIARTHRITKTYLAKVSSNFSSRIRSIVAPHKLDLIAQMSNTATSKYLSQIACTLRTHDIHCEPVNTHISAETLDDFIEKNHIDLVLTSDGRNGLCRWVGGGLARKHAQFLCKHTFIEEGSRPARAEKTVPDVKKMLVLLNRLDIEERLHELSEIITTQGVKKVYLADVSLTANSMSQRIMTVQELHPVKRVVVYLAKVSHAFGSRVRSIVSPQKLNIVARIGDAAANKYLLRIANTLAVEGIDVIPIGVSIPVEKIKEYIERNDVNIVVTGNGHTGLCSWPSQGFTGENLHAVLEGLPVKEVAPLFERPKFKAQSRLGTITGTILQFSFLFLFWFFLSGSYRLEHVLAGVVSAALVTYFTNNLVLSLSTTDKRGRILPTISQLWMAFTYVPVLFYKIIVANLQVAYLILHPKMPINPSFLRFQTQMKSSVAKVILANSITLTPGTLTVDLKDGWYTIHALVPSSAYCLTTGQLQGRVGAIFNEPAEKPSSSWCHSVSEVER